MDEEKERKQDKGRWKVKGKRGIEGLKKREGGGFGEC